MGITDIFSKRQKRARGDAPDVFTYDDLPTPLRAQIVHIARDAIGVDGRHTSFARELYELIDSTLCREYGVFDLVDRNTDKGEDSVFNFFLAQSDVNKALDVVEITFRAIANVTTQIDYRNNTRRQMKPDDAIKELNARFKEHGVGYEYASGEIIRVDSEFIHAEAVRPTLALLRGQMYAGANEEFLKAHEHYRHGRHKECLNESLKCFESVMKAICEKRRWTFQPNDAAKALIDVCLRNGLIPSFLQSEFTSLRALLESGLPTIRNRLGGHGQGSEVTEVDASMARYALHLTASNVLFLIEAETRLR